VEIILNLAWALCSVGLIGFWWRSHAANPKPIRVQLFALAMVVLLLLPVISVSDDLLSMQGAFETDSSVRRILHEDHVRPSATPAFMALPQGTTIAIASHRWILKSVHTPTPAAITIFASRSYTNRPPPQI
jgi:hypothetical protein